MEKLNFKQRMKQTLTILLVFAMIFTTVQLPAYAADEVGNGTCGTNATWSLSSDGTLTISGSGAMDTYGDAPNRPAWEDTEKYNGITIKKLVINGVSSVGGGAFNANKDKSKTMALEEITISESVESIGNGAFQGCKQLRNMTFTGKSQLKSIGALAFNACSTLKDIKIPDTVKEIGMQAFSGCTILQDIEIQGTLKNIGQNAFINCKALRSIVIPLSPSLDIDATKLTIGQDAFNGCDTLTKIYFRGNPTFIDEIDGSTATLGGGDGRDPVKVYYKDGYGSALNTYLNNNNRYYTGTYADVELQEDKSDSMQFAIKITDGLPIINLDEKLEFKANVYSNQDTNNETPLSEDQVETQCTYDAEDQTITVSVTPTVALDDGTYKILLKQVDTFSGSSQKIENSCTSATPITFTVARTDIDKDQIPNPTLEISNARVSDNDPEDPAEDTGRAYVLPSLPSGSGNYETDSFTATPSVTQESELIDTSSSLSVSERENKYILSFDLSESRTTDTTQTARIRIPVKQGIKYKTYNVTLDVVVKASPQWPADDKTPAESAGTITRTSDSITITGANPNCMYAYKEKGTDDSSYEWSNCPAEQKRSPENGTVKFEGLKSGTTYTVAVWYPEVGKDNQNLLGSRDDSGDYTKDGYYVKDTIPSTTYVTLYEPLDKPKAGEGYTIDYASETITPTSNVEFTYKIRKQGETNYSEISQPVTPGETYEIIKTKGEQTSEPTDFTIPARPAAPTNAFDDVKISKTDTSITLTGKKDYLYTIIAKTAIEDEKLNAWTTARKLESSITFDGLTAGTEYSILARADAVVGTQFASEAASKDVTTKTASSGAPTVEDLFKDCDLSATGINVKKTAGCEYLLVPADSADKDAYKNANGWTKVEKVEAEGILTLTQYCDTSGSMQTVEKGKKYIVLVRKYESDDAMASEIAISAPRAVLLDKLDADTVKTAVTIDYQAETVTIDENYEAILVTGETEPKNDVAQGSLLTGESITSAIDGTNSLYIRKKAGTDGTTPASEWTQIPVTPRAAAPTAGLPTVTQDNVTNESITIKNANLKYEYAVIPKGGALDGATWISLDEGKNDLIITGTAGITLQPGSEYTIYVREKAKSDERKPASAYTNLADVKIKKAPESAPADVTSSIANTAVSSDADINISAKKGYQYILVPSDTDPETVTDAQWKTAKSVSEDGAISFDTTFDGQKLQPGTPYKVLVRKPGGTDSMPSQVAASGVIYTKSERPNTNNIINTEDGITIDYAKEEVTLHGNTYEVFVSADGTEPGTAAATISNSGESTSITEAINENGKIFIRTKAGENGNPPASAWASVEVEGRTTLQGSVVNVPKDKVTDTTITIPNTNSDYEYIVMEGDTAPSGDWKAGNGGSIDFSGLQQDTTYKIYVRKKATENTPASNPAGPATVKTKVKPTQAPDTNITTGMASTAQNTEDTITVSGKKGYEYIVVPAGTNPSSITEEQWKAGGQKADDDGNLQFKQAYDSTAENPKQPLEQGKGYIVVVRKALDDDGMPSPAAASDIVYIKQPAPSADDAFKPSEGGNAAVSIDYAEGKITINDSTYEVLIPTAGAAEPGYDTPATSPAGGKIDITNVANNTTIYIRKKADGTAPASDWTPVTIKAEIVSDKTTVKAGDTAKLTVKLSPTDAGNGAAWKWESKNPEIATVDETTGELKALKAGTVSVTARIVRGSGEAAATGALKAEKEITISAASSSGGGGGSVIPPTSGGVTTTGSGSNKVTSAAAEVKNETASDASGKQETIAKITVSAANQRETINQAKANKSKEIIIKVNEKDIKDGAKPELNLEKSFVDSIVKDTEASLKIVMPNGEKTFTRAELEQLSKSAEGNTVTVDLASTDDPQQPTDPADKNAKTIKGVQKTAITLKSAKSKKGILLTWTKKKGYKVDYFEIYRSTKKNSGYGKKPFFRTKDGNVTKYLNTKNVKTGKKYYYKVRGVRTIDGKKYYTEYSNKAYRTAK